ncbi:MAG: L,D-transpeptidase family protein [Taibaiella sp.]|nr:L,D-transpeptidase family protein [Taibaiella sp.]
MMYAYAHNDYDPIWLSHGLKADNSAELFFKELEDLQWDGLDPERYQLANLRKLQEKLGKKETTLADAIAFDTAVTHSYLSAASDLLFGYITPKKADSLWFHVNDTTWKAADWLTNIQVKYVSLNEFRSKVPTYELLRAEYKRNRQLATDTELNNSIAALNSGDYGELDKGEIIENIIKKQVPWIEEGVEGSPLLIAYQNYIGLKPTGKTDSATLSLLAQHPDSTLPRIAANQERIRWMQQDFGDLYIIVDVPLMQLFLRQGGKNAMHMNVVVGKYVRQTPSLYARMANVVINPPWGVPPTILKQDVLPGLEKSGAAYLDKKGLTAYDRRGKAVNGSRINSKNYNNYTYKQAPGDDNALGYVKFNLPNPWDIYLHDTPHRLDFDKPDRALSSGCVRLKYPQEMALYILGELEKKKIDQPKLDSIIQTHVTQWNILSNKIPVHIAYLTAFEDTLGQHINFTRDIYRRDGKLIALMASNASKK